MKRDEEAPSLTQRHAPDLSVNSYAKERKSQSHEAAGIVGQMVEYAPDCAQSRTRLAAGAERLNSIGPQSKDLRADQSWSGQWDTD